jgi:hypothetical protein
MPMLLSAIPWDLPGLTQHQQLAGIMRMVQVHEYTQHMSAGAEDYLRKACEAKHKFIYRNGQKLHFDIVIALQLRC